MSLRPPLREPFRQVLRAPLRYSRGGVAASSPGEGGGAGFSVTNFASLTAAELQSQFGWVRSGAATMIDASGAVVYGAHNLAPRTEALSNTGSWTRTGLSGINAATDPNGGSAAFSLIEDGANSNHKIEASISGGQSARVLFQPQAREWIAVEAFGGFAYFRGFGLGSVGATSGVTGSIQALSGGWYEARITRSWAATPGSITIYAASANSTVTYTGNGTAAVTIAFPDVQLGVAMGTYLPNATSSAIYLPRAQHYQTAGVPGLLLEGARTNLGNRQATADTLTKDAVTFVSATDPSPIAGLPIHRYTETSTTAAHVVYGQGYSVTSGQTYTVGMWLPNTGRRYVGLRGDTTASGTPWVTLDRQTGATAVNGAAVAGGARQIGAGWWLWLTFVPTGTIVNWVLSGATSGAAIGTGVGYAPNYLGDGSEIACAAWQFELGAHASSNIPNAGTGTVLRAADSADIGPGANFDAIFPPATLGPELIANGGFDSWSGDNPTGWTIEGTEDASNYVTQSGSAARIVSNGTGIGISQTFLTVGKRYSFGCDVTVSTSGQIKIADSGTVDTTLSSGVGSKALTFIATGTLFQVRRAAACDVTFDNVSVRELIRQGTLVIEWCDVGCRDGDIFALHANGATTELIAAYYTGGSVAVLCKAGNVNQLAATLAGSVVVNGRNRIAISWGAGGLAASLNGATPSTNASATIPAPTHARYAGTALAASADGAEALRSRTTYATQRTGAALQALSAL